MKRTNAFISLLLAALLIAVAAGGLTWFFWDSRTDWPHFPSDLSPGVALTAEQALAIKSHDPEVVVHMERDYAYRIGDIVPVTLFIKEKPGTEVDLHSIALEGDFEIAGEPTFFVRRTADGARRIRVNIKLQSFSAVPKWRLKANLSYRLVATNEDFTVSLPALEAYTSNTWDGRDLVQEGKLVANHGFEPFTTAGLLLGGLIGAIYFFSLARRFGREKAMTLELKGLPNRFQLARRDFNQVWAKMEGGDRSPQAYAELSLLVRRLYRIETKTTLEASYFLLYSFNGPLQVVDILRSCDRVIYRGETLGDEEHLAIKLVFDKLVPSYSPELLSQLPPTDVVLRSAAVSLASAQDAVQRGPDGDLR